MVAAVQMDMDAAGVVGKAPGLFETANKPLERSDVLTVGKDGADQLHAVATSGINDPDALFFLAVDTAIGHELPDTSVRGNDLISTVVPAGHPQRSAQELRGGLRRLFPGDAGELDLNAEFVAEHFYILASFLLARMYAGSAMHAEILRTSRPRCCGFPCLLRCCREPPGEGAVTYRKMIFLLPVIKVDISGTPYGADWFVLGIGGLRYVSEQALKSATYIPQISISRAPWCQ